MASATAHTWRRRELRGKRAGAKAKKHRAKRGTPQFPIHPDGYDPNAPDAKRAK